MHIILSILATVVTILILLNRLGVNGIDIGWLNPFAWKRRRDWANKYHVDPIYSLDSPMEVSALFIVALAKSEGEMSAEQKRVILNKFEEVFHLSENAATELLSSTSFLLKENISVVQNTKKILAPSGDKFTEEQVSSAITLFRHISNLEGPENNFQREVIDAFENYFSSKNKKAEEWA